ncbi:hypothetical protein [Streptomyces echinatus]
MDNVVVTPHLAGSLRGSGRRMLGQAMAEELSPYIRGRRWRHEVVATR